MTTNDWHVDSAVWAAYAAGRLDHVAENAVDTHVVRCGQCRQAARSQVGTETLEPLWTGIALEVARPVVARRHRWLHRAGVREADTVLLGASDGLLVPWAVAVGSALACAMLTGLLPRYQDFSFLLLAPLIPVLAVVAAHDATDPLRELVSGTPYSKLRLALLRTTAALAVAVPLTLAVGLLIPGLQNLAFLWLLPGLGLTLGALVLLTWLPPWPAGVVVGSAWSTVVLVVGRLDDLASLTGPTAQLAYAVVVLLMTTLLVLRTTTLKLPGGIQ
jgi:hypothetical protein